MYEYQNQLKRDSKWLLSAFRRIDRTFQRQFQELPNSSPFFGLSIVNDTSNSWILTFILWFLATIAIASLKKVNWDFHQLEPSHLSFKVEGSSKSKFQFNFSIDHEISNPNYLLAWLNAKSFDFRRLRKLKRLNFRFEESTTWMKRF